MQRHGEGIYPTWLSVAVINTTTERNFEGKGFIWLTLSDHSSSLKEVRAGIQGRNLEEETGAKAMEEWCVLPYSVHCLVQPKTTCPGVVQLPMLDPPTLIISF